MNKGAVTCRRVELQARVEIFLGHMNTSICVKSKNIPTWAKIENTISSIFIGHDCKWNPLLKMTCNMLNFRNYYHEI